MWKFVHLKIEQIRLGRFCASFGSAQRQPRLIYRPAILALNDNNFHTDRHLSKPLFCVLGTSKWILILKPQHQIVLRSQLFLYIQYRRESSNFSSTQNGVNNRWVVQQYWTSPARYCVCFFEAWQVQQTSLFWTTKGS